jgi:hypothetical protein
MKKIKIYDYDGTRIDTCVVKDNNDVKNAFKRWKLKGLF